MWKSAVWELSPCHVTERGSAGPLAERTLQQSTSQYNHQEVIQTWGQKDLWFFFVRPQFLLVFMTINIWMYLYGRWSVDF